MTVVERDEQEIRLGGLAVAPGIVIGPARLACPGVPVARKRVEANEVADEQQRFREAVDRAEEKLGTLRRHFAEVLVQYAAIIDSHILMLRDRSLYERTLALIVEQRINAEWALEQSLRQVETLFARMDDPYIRSRFDDVRHVAERLFSELADTERERGQGDEKVIYVGRDFSPEDIFRLRDSAVGFLAAMGGETSHTAIVARTLGIPAVVGVRDIAARVHDGDTVVLDGSRGEVWINPSSRSLALCRLRREEMLRSSDENAAYAHLRAETVDGLRMAVEANLESIEEIGHAFQRGAAGIGLFRSEYLYLSSSMSPDEETQYNAYSRLLSLASPFPVTIRTLDVGGDKLFVDRSFGDRRCPAAREERQEANPALGLRAIRFSLRETALFEIQLRALLRASVHGTLRILFPMISSYCEMVRIREILDALCAELSGKRIPYDPGVAYGVMVEVPSAVAVADTLAQDVDFLSIGTNDLIQYALAIDRSNDQVAHMYEPLHPAVLRMIHHVVRAGHRAGIEVGICGEMAGRDRYLPVLLGLGLDSLSMNPQSIPLIKKMIRASRAEDAERLADQLLAQPSALDVRRCLREYLAGHYPDWPAFGKREEPERS